MQPLYQHNLNYNKKNCRWATIKEQCNNVSSNRNFTLNGVTKSISGWAEYSNMGKNTLKYRLDKGLNIDTAISLPIKRSNRYEKL